jgi:hypothetical protein
MTVLSVGVRRRRLAHNRLRSHHQPAPQCAAAATLTVYRERIADLREAFAAGGGTEVLEAARALVERVEIHAAAEPGGMPRLASAGQQKGPTLGDGPDLFLYSAEVGCGDRI